MQLALHALGGTMLAICTYFPAIRLLLWRYAFGAMLLAVYPGGVYTRVALFIWRVLLLLSWVLTPFFGVFRFFWRYAFVAIVQISKPKQKALLPTHRSYL